MGLLFQFQFELVFFLIIEFLPVVLCFVESIEPNSNVISTPFILTVFEGVSGVNTPDNV